MDAAASIAAHTTTLLARLGRHDAYGIMRRCCARPYDPEDGADAHVRRAGWVREAHVVADAAASPRTRARVFDFELSMLNAFRSLGERGALACASSAALNATVLAVAVWGLLAPRRPTVLWFPTAANATAAVAATERAAPRVSCDLMRASRDPMRCTERAGPPDLAVRARLLTRTGTFTEPMPFALVGPAAHCTWHALQ